MTRQTTLRTPAGMNAAEAILGDRPGAGDAMRTAILFRDERVSYGELAEHVRRAGAALAARGVTPGARVLLLLRDTPALVFLYLGALRIGAVPVTLHLSTPPAELALALAESAAVLAVVDAAALPGLRAEMAAGSDAAAAALLDAGDAAAGYPAVRAWLAAQTPVCPAVERAPDDMAFWIYTSGSTGRPKAVVHHQRDVLAAPPYLRDVLGVGPGDRIYATARLFYAYALGCCLFGALHLGVTLVLEPDWPDPAVVARTVARHRPTVMLSGPPMYRALLAAGVAREPTFAAVRRYVTAGERLPEAVGADWRAATGQPILEGYGTTETIHMVLAVPPGGDGAVSADTAVLPGTAVPPGTAGRPAPGVELMLKDEAERTITTPGRAGVLWVQLASLGGGYWQRPERTARAFRGPWFVTGDVFRVDEAGWWFHLGRDDEALKIAGQWVDLVEVESRARALADVADAAAFGVPGPDGREQLALALVPRNVEGAEAAPAAAADEAMLLARVRDSFAAAPVALRPSALRLAKALPRTVTGKVQRYRLRQLWLRGMSLDGSALDGTTVDGQ